MYVGTAVGTRVGHSEGTVVGEMLGCRLGAIVPKQHRAKENCPTQQFRPLSPFPVVQQVAQVYCASKHLASLEQETSIGDLENGGGTYLEGDTVAGVGSGVW